MNNHTTRPHAVVAVPITKEIDDRIKLFVKAYQEHGGKQTERELRQAFLDIGLQLMEKELFDTINQLNQGEQKKPPTK